MKKLLLLVLSVNLISASSNFAMNLHQKAILAGSPFYAASLYCFYKHKQITKKRTANDCYSALFDLLVIDGPLISGGLVACLAGALTSTLTYNYLKK